MSTEVPVPAVGESITSGIVSVWHKKSGDQVKAGEALFTLETDKVSTEINAERDGILQTRVAEGAEVKIGDVVAVIEEGSASASKPADVSTAGPATKKSKSAPAKQSEVISPAVRRLVTEKQLDPERITGSGKGGRVTKGDALAAAENRKSAPQTPSPKAAPADGASDAPVAQPESGRFTRKTNVAAPAQDRRATCDGAAHGRDANDV